MKCQECGKEMEVIEQDFDPPTKTGYAKHKCPDEDCGWEYKDVFP